ncbi:DUF1963 domain-containing protein [Oceanobacillus kapialis]|uniref:DUF1963 domain-containing protein n=1 Tax=Oceanobacillus kapialis TaxID=481353 RepID=UPI00384BF7FB
MKEDNQLKLPAGLEIYCDQIEQTMTPSIQLSTSKRKTNPYESKFAGEPYWPNTMSYPRDKNDKPMILLAQLNFEKITKLENMPERGILQFFCISRR